MIEKIKTLVAMDSLNHNLLIEHTRKINELIDVINNSQQEEKKEAECKHEISGICIKCNQDVLGSKSKKEKEVCKHEWKNIGLGVDYCKLCEDTKDIEDQPSKPSIRESVKSLFSEITMIDGGEAVSKSKKIDQILDLITTHLQKEIYLCNSYIGYEAELEIRQIINNIKK